MPGAHRMVLADSQLMLSRQRGERSEVALDRALIGQVSRGYQFGPPFLQNDSLVITLIRNCGKFLSGSLDGLCGVDDLRGHVVPAEERQPSKDKDTGGDGPATHKVNSQPLTCSTFSHSYHSHSSSKR